GAGSHLSSERQERACGAGSHLCQATLDPSRPHGPRYNEAPHHRAAVRVPRRSRAGDRRPGRGARRARLRGSPAEPPRPGAHARRDAPHLGAAAPAVGGARPGAGPGRAGRRAAARVLALAMSARLAVARDTWDVVQSHERTLRQDVYRAGEGCHRAYLASKARPRARGLYHRIVLALERRVFASTPRIVAIAESGRREIEALYGVAPSRMTVVYNGVDLERFHPRNRERYRKAVRVEAGVPADALAVLFVGSGFRRKGLATAIEAFAALYDRRSRL